jgi:hypothetical protein
MRGATVGAYRDAWADDMAKVNQMGPEGAERQQVIVLGGIARSLAVIADHLTEGKPSIARSRAVIAEHLTDGKQS